MAETTTLLSQQLEILRLQIEQNTRALALSKAEARILMSFLRRHD